VKKILLGVALSSLLMACPAAPAPTDNEQNLSLLGTVSGYSGGAGSVRVFVLQSGNTLGSQVATGTIDASGVFSVVMPNSATLAPLLPATDLSADSICSGGSATGDGCTVLADGAAKFGSVAVGVYSSGNALLGYLKLKMPSASGNASRTVWHLFSTGQIAFQARKTTAVGVESRYWQLKRGWNISVITSTTTPTGNNVDWVTSGIYPRDVQWILGNGVEPVGAALNGN
jgi:hypothetical protein